MLRMTPLASAIVALLIGIEAYAALKLMQLKKPLIPIS